MSTNYANDGKLGAQIDNGGDCNSSGTTRWER